MYRIYLQDGLVVGKESMHHLTPEQIAEVEGFFVEDDMLDGIDLPAKPIYSGDVLAGIENLPFVPYEISKNPVLIDEEVIITVPAGTIVISEAGNQATEDGIIEFSSNAVGKYDITLRLAEHRDTVIEMEVVAG